MGQIRISTRQASFLREIDAPGLPGRCHAPSPLPAPHVSQGRLHRTVCLSWEITSKGPNRTPMPRQAPMPRTTAGGLRPVFLRKPDVPLAARLRMPPHRAVFRRRERGCLPAHTATPCAIRRICRFPGPHRQQQACPRSSAILAGRRRQRRKR